mmetsp:Transcript_59148/g.108727  ORF Transcript_59148/g.108727 Transcript_59148/m.108727 type:complete len:153 (+) Transcript_59148:1-459(+)
MRGLEKADQKDAPLKSTSRQRADEKEMGLRILNDILVNHKVAGLPPGVTAMDIFDMLDEDGHGELSHEEFVVGFGRILLADSYEIACKQLINSGRLRRLAIESEERHAARNAVVEKRAVAAEERLGKIEKQVAGTQEQLGRIEQQLAKLLAK